MSSLVSQLCQDFKQVIEVRPDTFTEAEPIQ